MTDNNQKTTAPGWSLLATVFITGACVLVIELVGTRLLAPFFGSGIYTWSALIAVTLAALALGYVFGGRLSDRVPQKDILYTLCLAAGLWTVITPWLATKLLPSLVHISEIRLGILLSSGLLFFPNLFLLGAIGPFTIRLLTKSVDQVGSYSGLVFSVSTIGSLLGALITGFVLIPNFGVRIIFLLCGILLLALAFTAFVRSRRIIPALIALALISIALFGITNQKQNNDIEIIDSSPSFYGHIHVVRINPVKMLLVDGIGQNYVIENGDYTTPYIDFLSSIPVLRTYPSTRLEVSSGRGHHIEQGLNNQAVSGRAVNNDGTASTRKGLVIGLGAGELVERLKDMNYEMEAVEIDVHVANMAVKHFGLEISPDRLHIMDGRVFLARGEKLFDYIILDAFSAEQVAGHLLSMEALLLAKGRLQRDGILAINLTSQPGGDDLASLQQTLKRVYPHVLSFGYQHGGGVLSTNVFLASAETITLSFNPRLFDVSTAKNVKQFFANELGNLVTDVIYSDDYNPISHQRRYVQLLWRKEMLMFFKDEQLTWLMY